MLLLLASPKGLETDSLILNRKPVLGLSANDHPMLPTRYLVSMQKPT